MPGLDGGSSLEAGSYRERLAAGLSFLRRDRLLLVLAVSLDVSNFLNGPLYPVVLPVYVLQTTGTPATLGLLMSGVGLGALGGAAIDGLGFQLTVAVLGAGLAVLALSLLLLAVLSQLDTKRAAPSPDIERGGRCLLSGCRWYTVHGAVGPPTPGRNAKPETGGSAGPGGQTRNSLMSEVERPPLVTYRSR